MVTFILLMARGRRTELLPWLCLRNLAPASLLPSWSFPSRIDTAATGSLRQILGYRAPLFGSSTTSSSCFLSIQIIASPRCTSASSRSLQHTHIIPSSSPAYDTPSLPLSKVTDTRAHARRAFLKRLVDGDQALRHTKSPEQIGFLHTLSDEQLIDHAAQIGSKGDSSKAEQLLDYLTLISLQPRKRLQDVSRNSNTFVLHDIRAKALAISRRSICAVESLLQNASNSLEQTESFITSDVAKDGTAAHSSIHRSGIASLLSPDGVLRSFLLLIQCSQMREQACLNFSRAPLSPKQYVFDFLPKQECLGLLNKIAQAHHNHLLSVFTSLHDVMMQRNDPQYPSAYDMVSMIAFCLRDSVWTKGGPELLENTFDLLLARTAFSSQIQRASEDAKAWLSKAEKFAQTQHVAQFLDKGQAFQLFCRILLVRMILQAGLFEQVEPQVSVLINLFKNSAADADTPVRYLLSVCNALINHGFGSLQASQNAVVQSAQILSNHVHELAGFVKRVSAATPLLEEISSKSLTCQSHGTTLRLLLLFKSQDLPLHQLVNSATLVKLLQQANTKERYVLTYAELLQLVGWRDGVVYEVAIADCPRPLRRSVLLSLAAMKLKEPVSWLWRRWTTTENDADNYSLLADPAVMKGLVKLYCKRPSESTSRLDILASGGGTQKRGNDMHATFSGDTKFARKVLELFKTVKPMNCCDHIDLTALGSAHFHLGDENAAFADFAQILHRKEVPDETDVLVLLHAVARVDVERAVRLYAKYRKSQQAAGRITDKADRSIGLFAGLRPSIKAWAMLLRQAFYEDRVDLAKQVVEMAMLDRFSDRRARANDLLTIKLIYEAFRVGSTAPAAGQPTVWPWRKIAHVAKYNATSKQSCLADATSLMSLAHAAAHGVPLSKLPEAVLQQRRRSTRRSVGDAEAEAPVQLSRYTRDADLMAAIDLLELAARQSSNIDSNPVSLILIKIRNKAQSLFSGGGRRGQMRPIWTALLDRVVIILRQSEGFMAPAVGPISSSLLNEAIFRQIIGAYVELRDWSGALQARAWMSAALGPQARLGRSLADRLEAASNRLRASSAAGGHSRDEGHQLRPKGQDETFPQGESQEKEAEVVPRDKLWWRYGADRKSPV